MEIGKLPYLGRYASIQLISAEVEVLELGEAEKPLGWDLSRDCAIDDLQASKGFDLIEWREIYDRVFFG
ncbi:hypothetical protein HPP92_013961 [Vanilla planifolia]|uniref:Uncharacterized protein n=1 Tax=Vanilla planifolia TaxID=51239 RepID=A0A835QVR4_VANPL|nr:hypothetical protein HPP92_013961 [Vanilla planifolia]